MPGATTKGLPFPLVTDPLYQGAAAIQALADSLDYTAILALPSDTFTAATLLSAYPLGLSLISLPTSAASAGGWPTGISGHVLTIKTTSARAVQFFYRNDTTATGAFYRQLFQDGTPHSAWIGATGHYAEYVGTASLNTATSPTSAVTVTFPVGRFTTPPRVVTGGQSHTWFVGINGITKDAVALIGRHYQNSTVAGSITAHFHAIQHASDAASGG